MKFLKQTALLVAGSLFLFSAPLCSFTGGRVKKGVVVQGVAVGGLRFFEAQRRVREEIAKTLLPLTVQTPCEEYTARYPELSFTDNVEKTLRQARAGECLTATVERQWADAEETIQTLCDKNARTAQNATLSFSAAGFTYRAGQNGVYCDYALSLARVTEALKENRDSVSLACSDYPPQITVENLKERTRLLARFSTQFDGENTNRVHNIRLAASKLSGTEIKPHAAFSFNQRVGRRTAENGYKESTVIFDGAFVKGVGGGVCQLSTTLFNAALRAGLTVSESRPHSLCVSYVPPSLDAMVSEYSDLKLVNPYEEPVYLFASVTGDRVTVAVYGLPSGNRYQTESVILYRLAPPPEEVVEGDEDKILRPEKQGIASESYLLTYNAKGELVSRKLLRRDNYQTVQGIRQVKKAGETTPSFPSNE